MKYFQPRRWEASRRFRISSRTKSVEERISVAVSAIVSMSISFALITDIKIERCKYVFNGNYRVSWVDQGFFMVIWKESARYVFPCLDVLKTQIIH
jgi:hypothetical protein